MFVRYYNPYIINIVIFLEWNQKSMLTIDKALFNFHFYLLIQHSNEVNFYKLITSFVFKFLNEIFLQVAIIKPTKHLFPLFPKISVLFEHSFQWKKLYQIITLENLRPSLQNLTEKVYYVLHVQWGLWQRQQLLSRLSMFPGQCSWSFLCHLCESG